MEPLGAVLGVIGTVFGCFAIVRQMDIEARYIGEMAEMRARLENYKKAAQYARQLQDKDINETHNLACEAKKWIDTYEQMNSITSGEYRKQVDEKSKEVSWKHVDEIDPKEALLAGASASGYADKLKATMQKMGYQ